MPQWFQYRIQYLFGENVATSLVSRTMQAINPGKSPLALRLLLHDALLSSKNVHMTHCNCCVCLDFVRALFIILNKVLCRFPQFIFAHIAIFKPRATPFLHLKVYGKAFWKELLHLNACGTVCTCLSAPFFIAVSEKMQSLESGRRVYISSCLPLLKSAMIERNSKEIKRFGQDPLSSIPKAKQRVFVSSRRRRNVSWHGHTLMKRFPKLCFAMIWS